MRANPRSSEMRANEVFEDSVVHALPDSEGRLTLWVQSASRDFGGFTLEGEPEHQWRVLVELVEAMQARYGRPTEEGSEASVRDPMG